MSSFRCPLCQRSDVNHLGQYHPIMVHWILNPGLAFNELVLGQAIAREAVSCAHCSPGNMHNIGKYLACPGCGRYHSTNVWQGTGVFGYWLGFFCPDCGHTIPRVWNATSLLILALTFIIWWPILKLLGDKPQQRGQQRARQNRDQLALTQEPWPATFHPGDLVTGDDQDLKITRRQGLHQCPYCHDHVEPSEAVACTDCLARHHEECWDNHKECASCGGLQRYSQIEQSPGRQRETRQGQKDGQQ